MKTLAVILVAVFAFSVQANASMDGIGRLIAVTQMKTGNDNDTPPPPPPPPKKQSTQKQGKKG